MFSDNVACFGSNSCRANISVLLFFSFCLFIPTHNSLLRFLPFQLSVNINFWLYLFYFSYTNFYKDIYPKCGNWYNKIKDVYIATKADRVLIMVCVALFFTGFDFCIIG